MSRFTSGDRANARESRLTIDRVYSREQLGLGIGHV